MKIRRAFTWVGGFACGFAFTPVALATTFSASVNPAGSGTASAPMAQNVTFDLEKIKAGADGNPTSGVIGLDEILAPQFASGFDHFAVCAKDAIASSGRNQPNCPSDSVLGTAATTFYVPAAAGSVTTDKGFMYKTGSDTFAAWLHVSQPIEVGAALYGVLKPASGSSGLIASWDFTPAGKAQNPQHLELRASMWRTVWSIGGQTATPPPSNSPSSSTKTKHKSKRQTCMQKARKIKNGKKRKQRVRACRRAAARHRHRGAKKSTRAAARAAAATGFSPFMSTGCPAGSWTLQAHLTYADGSQESPQTSVPCTSGAPPGGGSPPGGGGAPGGGPIPNCDLPLICSGSAVARAQIARDERVGIGP